MILGWIIQDGMMQIRIVEVSNRGLYAPQAADLQVNIELL
jgi:hypothetical protein